MTAIDLAKNVQKEPWFLDINPNGRIPALTDVLPNGEPIHIFESGAIMQYLVDRYDTEYKVSYPRGTKEYWEMTSWVSGCSICLQSKADVRNALMLMTSLAFLADGWARAHARVCLSQKIPGK